MVVVFQWSMIDLHDKLIKRIVIRPAQRHRITADSSRNLLGNRDVGGLNFKALPVVLIFHLQQITVTLQRRKGCYFVCHNRGKVNYKRRLFYDYSFKIMKKLFKDYFNEVYSKIKQILRNYSVSFQHAISFKSIYKRRVNEESSSSEFKGEKPFFI